MRILRSIWGVWPTTVVRLAADGSRRILDNSLAVLVNGQQPTWPEFRAIMLEWAEGDPLVLWGSTREVNLLSNFLSSAGQRMTWLVSPLPTC